MYMNIRGIAIMSCYLLNGAMGSLSPEEVKEEYGLTLEVVKERLKQLFAYIDVNHKGYLTQEDIKAWVGELHTAAASNPKGADSEIAAMDTNQDQKLDWIEMFDALKNVHNQKIDPKGEEMLRKRFAVADVNQDGFLDSKEVPALWNPALTPGMLTLEAQEIMANQDTDQDGTISMAEYMASDKDGLEPAEMEKDFKELDKNSDGHIDMDELMAALKDPSPAAIEESLEIFQKIESPRITSQDFEQHWEALLHSPITEQGELLRTPSHFGLARPLPYPDVDEDPTVEEEEPAEEL